MITRPRSLARVSTLAAIATASASSAQAAIIVKNTSPVTSDNFTEGDVTWDVDGNGHDDALFKNYLRGTSTYFGIKRLYGLGAFGFKGEAVQKLSAGAMVGPTAVFCTTSVAFESGRIRMSGGFVSGESALVGFRFTLLPGSTTLYGWANITATNGDSDDDYGTFTINHWAYDDTGASILAGQTEAAAVPEPAAYAAGLGGLALGAAALRRRRQKRAVAA
jgi:hypothetical protein